MRPSEERADQIIVCGFLAAYFGLMGSMLVGIVPALDQMHYLIFYALLPLAGVGVAGVIAGNVFHPRKLGELG